MKPSFDNLKGRRVYQFVLDEKTGKIEDISDSFDYVKVVRCKDCIYRSKTGTCSYWYDSPCVDDYDYCSGAKRKYFSEGFFSKERPLAKGEENGTD